MTAAALEYIRQRQREFLDAFHLVGTGDNPGRVRTPGSRGESSFVTRRRYAAQFDPEAQPQTDALVNMDHAVRRVAEKDIGTGRR